MINRRDFNALLAAGTASGLLGLGLAGCGSSGKGSDTFTVCDY